MKTLIDKIKSEGQVYPGNILKVDSFLNHQIDVELLKAIGEAFFQRFKHTPIDKILTIEASGIAIAVIAAQYFKVPVVFAKKGEVKHHLVYSTLIHSYTKNKTSIVQVNKNFLKENERILIIDDFLAKGEAVYGLIDLVNQAKAQVVGIGIVIEKGFQEGGARLRSQGYHLESLAIIDSMDQKGVQFRE